MMFFFFTEKWKDIPNYEGLYQVSSYGRVRSLDRIVIDKNGRRSIRYGKTIAQRATTTCHYMVVDLCKNGIRKHLLTHRVVASAFLGLCDGLEVNHIDGNYLNNKVNNLELVTHQENIDHSIKMGLKCDYGEKSVHAKVTNKQAEWIRQQVYNGRKQKDVAKELGLSKQLINRIVNYKGYIK